MHYIRKGHPPKKNRRVLLTRQFQTDWLKVTFLQEVETAVRLGIKSWFGDVGLAQGTPY